MRNSTGWLIAIVFLVSGCTFNVEVLRSAPSFATPTEPPTVISPVATISATAETPSPTPTLPSGPLFYNAFFTLNPTGGSRQNFFPMGTKQIYLVWSYQNMRAGLTLRRDWYLNGQLWITHEEPWDITKYAASGTAKDVSVYDFDAGLPSGVYELRMYIDNVIQPIGTSITGQPETQITFEVQPADQASAGYASPDLKWGVYVFDEKRVVLQDANGASKELFTAREVPYVSWFGDSRHFLFVDREHTKAQPGMPVGLRDDLWIVDVPSGEMTLLYKSGTAFQGRAGPVPSPDGRYLASLEGLAFADACMIDSRLIFFELAGDYKSVSVIKQAEFDGLPTFNEGVIFPVEDGSWQNGNYLVTMDGTCNADPSKLGLYTFDIARRTATQFSASVTPSTPGDLGVGRIHGRLTDAVTGQPVAGATVTCEHHSYSSQATCSGSVTTDADGLYVFENIFFHDTDRITLAIRANGFLPEQISQTSFTINDMEVNIALKR